MSTPLFLAEITAYNPGTASVVTLRYATAPFTTQPGETPANTIYAPRLKQPAAMKRDCFNTGTTQGQSRVGFGDCVLLNPDGALDALLTYGFDGRTITIRQGTVGAAYPSGFTTVLVATMQSAEFTESTVTIKVRDRQQETAIPLQPTKFAGNNALPAGLEGTADLLGKPKPVCYGQVLNVSPPCVNTSKLIYQVNNGAVNSVDAVYDKGIALATAATQRTSQTSGFGATNINGLAYGAGLYVAVGDSGKLYSSPDGVTWTSRTSQFGTTNIAGVCFGNGLFVAVGASGTMSTSPDGITWTLRTSGFGTTNINGVAYGNGLYVAFGASGTLTTSTNGTTGWTTRTSGFTTNAINAAVYGAGLWVIVGAVSSYATSPDGTTWTFRNSMYTSADALNAIAYDGRVFVAMGGHGITFTSADGISWTIIYSASAGAFGTGNVRGITVGAGQFVAVDDAGRIGTSSDGAIWTMRTGVATVSYAATFGTLFVIAGSAGQLSTSATVATYANSTDLLDDTKAPAPGCFKYYAAGGYFRLGSSPVGTVTADVTQGANAAARTTAQIFKTLLTDHGFSSGDYNAGDLTTLDAANSAVIGFWTDQETTLDKVLDQVAGSLDCWWGVDQTGVFRIQQWLAPSGSPVVSLVQAQLLKPLERQNTNDPGNGIPFYRVTVRAAKNYTVQTTDLAGAVTPARRAVLALDYQDSTATDATVQTTYLLAQELVQESLLVSVTDAASEATRRQTLRGTRRDRFAIQVKLDATNGAVDLGNVLNLTHSRFSLTGGKLFRVLGVDPDFARQVVTFTIWG